MDHCPQCGAPIDEEQKCCPNCGCQLNRRQDGNFTANLNEDDLVQRIQQRIQGAGNMDIVDRWQQVSGLAARHACNAANGRTLHDDVYVYVN